MQHGELPLPTRGASLEEVARLPRGVAKEEEPGKLERVHLKNGALAQNLLWRQKCTKLFHQKLRVARVAGQNHKHVIRRSCGVAECGHEGGGACGVCRGHSRQPIKERRRQGGKGRGVRRSLFFFFLVKEQGESPWGGSGPWFLWWPYRGLHYRPRPGHGAGDCAHHVCSEV